jgi:hypothetical protein
MSTIDIANMTTEQLQAALAQAQADNATLKEKAAKQATISFKVSEKGAVSVYGLGRFPVTLYGAQMDRLLAAAPAIQAFMDANRSKLTTKPTSA